MVKLTTARSYFKKSIAVFAITACVSALASAQTASDTAADNYAELLQRIAHLETTIAHKQLFISKQKAQMNALREQINGTQGVIDSIDPMIEKMRVAIASEIKSDLPFNPVERNNRLAGFDEIVEDKDARPADKMRRALGIYDAEVAYGQTVQSYAGDNPVTTNAGARLAACEQDRLALTCGLSKDQTERFAKDPQMTVADIKNELKDGTYLRYGRLALVYMNHDGSGTMRYDGPTKTWVEMSGNRALDIRRAIKMAKGEAAPSVVYSPIYISN